MGDSETLNEEEYRLKELIINNCQRMNKVIQNVLNLSRRQQAKPEEIHLLSFLQQFKKNFLLSKDCHIMIGETVSKDELVVFDKNHLEQILIILCDNSMRHGRNAKNEVDIFISCHHEDENKLTITIEDTGPGIEPEIQEDIFEPFFSTSNEGIGMGLFIAKELCEINQVRLYSIPKKTGVVLPLPLIHNMSYRYDHRQSTRH